MRPEVGYGYRDTVFFKEQPKILDITKPFFPIAYELYHDGNNFNIIGGSIFLNDAHTLSFVQNGPEGKRPYYVMERPCLIGTEYPQGFFVPFSASPENMRMIASLLNKLADLDEESAGEKGEFFEYEDFIL